jgi:UDPglucose 6-dehydrogenase
VIGFAGLSHLGIVSAVAAAGSGTDIIAYDPDRERCAALGRGDLPILEPGLPERLAAHRAQIRFTADPAPLADCDVVFLSIDVATDEQNRSDLAPLERLLEDVAHGGSGCRADCSESGLREVHQAMASRRSAARGRRRSPTRLKR